MIKTFAPTNKDVYKVFHKFAYKPGVTHVYSNMTPRFGKHSNIKDSAEILNFGLQLALIDMLNEWADFFAMGKARAVKKYSRIVNAALGKEIPTGHIAALHDLQYLPLEVRALPEGILVPYGMPVYTIENTVEGFGWLTNMVETDMSANTWGQLTSATTAFAYRLRFEQEESLDKNMIPFMGHDFSYRGMFGREAAIRSALGHLTSFVGSDTLPAIEAAEYYYNANVDNELVLASVDATEHSVCCSGVAVIEQMLENGKYKGKTSDEWIRELEAC